jgi:hypothetical protein
MGSFNIICSISNTVISDGDRASIQILVPGGSENFNSHKNIIVSESGTQEFFSPFGFPINGRYDSYGRLRHIENDINVEMLEKFFNINIYELLNLIHSSSRTYDEEVKNTDIIDNLFISFFRTEVIDYIDNGSLDINIDNPEEYTRGAYIKSILDGIDDYNITNISERISYIESMAEADITEEISKEFFDLIRKQTTRKKTYIQSLWQYNMFELLPIDLIFKDYIIKQYNLISTMTNELKVLLRPSLYGLQEGDDLYRYKFNKEINNLIINDLESESEWLDGEEKSIIKTHNRSVKLDKLYS